MSLHLSSLGLGSFVVRSISLLAPEGVQFLLGLYLSCKGCGMPCSLAYPRGMCTGPCCCSSLGCCPKAPWTGPPRIRTGASAHFDNAQLQVGPCHSSTCLCFLTTLVLFSSSSSWRIAPTSFTAASSSWIALAT